MIYYCCFCYCCFATANEQQFDWWGKKDWVSFECGGKIGANKVKGFRRARGEACCTRTRICVCMCVSVFVERAFSLNDY